MLELSCSWDGNNKCTLTRVEMGDTFLTFAHSELWSPDRKQPWLKDRPQSLPGVRLASYVPGCSLAMSTDAVTKFVCVLPFVLSPWSFSLSSTAHQGYNILFRVAELQPHPQTEDMWLHLPQLLWEDTSPECIPQCYLHPTGTNTSVVGMNRSCLFPEVTGGRAQRTLINRSRSLGPWRRGLSWPCFAY